MADPFRFNWSSDPASEAEKTWTGPIWRRPEQHHPSPSTSSTSSFPQVQPAAPHKSHLQDNPLPNPPSAPPAPAPAESQTEAFLQLLEKAERLAAELDESRREAARLAEELAQTRRRLDVVVEERDVARSEAADKCPRGVEDKGTQTEGGWWGVDIGWDGGDGDDEDDDDDNDDNDSDNGDDGDDDDDKDEEDGNDDGKHGQDKDTETRQDQNQDTSPAPEPGTPCPTTSLVPATLINHLAQSQRTISTLHLAAHTKDKQITDLHCEIRDLWSTVDSLRDMKRHNVALAKFLNDTLRKNVELESVLAERTEGLAAAAEAGRRVVGDLVDGGPGGEEGEGRVRVVVKVLTRNAGGGMWDLPVGWTREGVGGDGVGCAGEVLNTGRVRVYTASGEETEAFVRRFRRTAYRAAVVGGTECVLIYGRMVCGRMAVLGAVLCAVIEGLFWMQALGAGVVVRLSVESVGSEAWRRDDKVYKREARSAAEAKRLAWTAIEDERRRGGRAHTAFIFHLDRGPREGEGLIYIVRLDDDAEDITALAEWLRATGQGRPAVSVLPQPGLMAMLAPVMSSESVVAVVATVGRLEDDADEGEVDVRADDGTVDFVRRVVGG
ncbi:hypothetical protein CONLIGDRAFT_687841 [Coniochaeta ligniaria NRRL 30616]|uniref:Uncharacterized protein n=1 Tax=Coniochaeta ligniaria NRRL 30616 TaxID=1408157 RepID=A0A1J7I3R5_9PEZI|nr:hypothetical protein CONLIGDRAFT_687841 [Coniochaeta ligniaria NRRL 30616]